MHAGLGHSQRACTVIARHKLEAPPPRPPQGGATRPPALRGERICAAPCCACAGREPGTQQSSRPRDAVSCASVSVSNASRFCFTGGARNAGLSGSATFARRPFMGRHVPAEPQRTALAGLLGADRGDGQCCTPQSEGNPKKPKQLLPLVFRGHTATRPTRTEWRLPVGKAAHQSASGALRDTRPVGLA